MTSLLLQADEDNLSVVVLLSYQQCDSPVVARLCLQITVRDLQLRVSGSKKVMSSVQPQFLFYLFVCRSTEISRKGLQSMHTQSVATCFDLSCNICSTSPQKSK